MEYENYSYGDAGHTLVPYENQDLRHELEASGFKAPPHSMEAEQSVLGGLMLDNNTFDRIVDLVSEGDFFRQEHREIFAAATYLIKNNQPADVVTLSDRLEVLGQLNRVGGIAYLAELAKNTPSTANIRQYASTVRERATVRKLIQAGSEIVDAAYNPDGKTPADLLQMAEASILAIAEERPKAGDLEHANSVLQRTIDKIDRLFNAADGLPGQTTGFADLDEKTRGLQPADLIIVAGRPSMGKTTFAMNLVEKAITTTDKAVAVFSLEMPSDTIMTRLLSSMGTLEVSKLLNPKLMTDDDWPRLTAAVNLVNDRKLFIDETAGISPADMRARCRRLVREHGPLALIMVDYLQLMRIPAMAGAESRTGEISEISRSLKAMAKEFNCPVVALSQLNRSLESRPNKRPMNSDLRESGAIEQDADLIMFVYRDEVYHPETEYKGTAEIIIGKQRNGPIGTVRLAFQGQYNRFRTLAPDSLAQMDESFGSAPSRRNRNSLYSDN